MPVSLIKDASDLREWFVNVSEASQPAQCLYFGINITAEVRKEAMTDLEQGNVLVKEGRKEIQFLDLNDGVYNAYIVSNTGNQTEKITS